MRRKRNLPPLSGSEYMGYIGFIDGAPYVQIAGDYGDYASFVELFPTKKAARRRFGDVRRVRITVEIDR